MANARGKAIDNTHLSIDQAAARGFIHRDYLSHCLRWSHVAKFIREKNRYKEAVVLDIGCGRDLPLARMLHTDRVTPACYVGLDYNKRDKLNTYEHNFGDKPFYFYGGIEFPAGVAISHNDDKIVDGFLVTVDGDADWAPLPTIITCFEVIEHVEPAHARLMIEKIAELALETVRSGKPCDIFISTPNWDPKVGAADNHVNEMKYAAVGYLLESSSLKIENHWGTFASQKDYDITDCVADLVEGDDGYGAVTGIAALWDALQEYYDSNYLSTIFAPLFPSKARNVLWHCKPAAPDADRHFDIDAVEQPWTSSEKWQELKA